MSESADPLPPIKVEIANKDAKETTWADSSEENGYDFTEMDNLEEWAESED